MADVRADMVANVMEIYVSEGDQINIGDTIVLLESMKMEIPVIAEEPGEVTRIAVSVGDVVQEGDLLVSIAD
jgi:biotin carboxyl carrier protein